MTLGSGKIERCNGIIVRELELVKKRWRRTQLKNVNKNSGDVENDTNTNDYDEDDPTKRMIHLSKN